MAVEKGLSPTSDAMPTEGEERGRMRMGLQFKAMLFAAALTFFASFLPVLFFHAQVNDAIEGEVRDRGRSIASGLARTSRLAVVVGDRSGLDRLTEGVIEEADVLYVAVADDSGEFLSAREGRKDDGEADPLGQEGLGAARRRELEPEASIQPLALGNGHPYYEVIEPIVKQTQADSLDELGFESEASSDDEKPEAVGFVVIGVSRARATQKIERILLVCLGVAGVVFLVGTVAASVGTRRVVAPIVELARGAEAIASGDLTREVSVTSSDETAVLARSFSRMAGSLKAILARIDETSRTAEGAMREARNAAEGIMEGSVRQSESVTASSSAILEMDGAIRDVAQSAEKMSSSVVGTTTSLEELGTSIRQIDDSVSTLQALSADAGSSVLEMGANINEAAESIEDLGEQVERSSASIEEMAASISNVDELAAAMQGAADTTSTTIEEMAKSIREVGVRSKSASEFAERAARDGREGLGAVRSSAEGMETIRKSFEEARGVVLGLGDSSRRIGEIVDIIDDVADRTNLLSLNAAIIAAEAGEQGRAFAVVAEEIRELAVKTAASTRDIAGLIRGVQNDVQLAVSRMEQNDQFVKEGVQLSQKAAQALAKIQEGTEQSLEMAQLIERATVTQLEGSESMTLEMERLRAQALEISRATQEQSRGGKAISESMSEMRDKAVMVKKASAEQRVGGERISQSMEKVTEMIEQIARATREQSSNAKMIMDAANEVESLALEVGRSTGEQTKSSGQVVTSVEIIHDATEQNKKLAADLAGRLGGLEAQIETLREQVSYLRIE